MCQRLAIILVILIAISTLVIHASASNDGIAFGKLETGWLHGFRAPFYGAANVTTYGGTFHSGIHEFVRDITPNTGAEYYDVEIWNGDVLASGDGTVIFADTYAVTGCEVAGKPSTVTSSVVVVEHVVAPGSGEHAQRFFSVYEHVENWVVESGDIVYAGQKLASMGNTGCSTGPHLHFGLYADTNSKPQWGSHYRTATTISVNMNWTWEPAAGLACVGTEYCGNFGASVDRDPEDGRTLAVGAWISGTNGPHLNDSDILLLRVTGGSSVSVEMVASDPGDWTLRPYILVFDDISAGGGLIAVGGDPSATRASLEVKLPGSGVKNYRVVAAPYGGFGAGPYSLSVASSTTTPVGPPPKVKQGIDRTHLRLDQPVGMGEVVRTWMWGPEPFTDIITERYDQGSTTGLASAYAGRQLAVDGTEGQRWVTYYDKSRMEVTYPDGDPNSIWYVTNGLLVNELVSGQMQIGDSQFDIRAPADVNIAGDPGEHPTYFDINNLGLRAAPATPVGAPITLWVTPAGGITGTFSTPPVTVTAAERVTVPGIDHTVASVFWEFMNSTGTVYEDGQFIQAPLFQSPYYATGYPITEAYWSLVRIGGNPTTVLWQCFERRCLTYNPANPDGWKVEAGNVGRHYYQWRYGVGSETKSPVPAAPSNVTAEAIAPDTIVLRWVDNSDNEYAFPIYMDGDDGSCCWGGTNHTSYIFDWLSPGSYHCFRVTAINSEGESPLSNEACTQTPAAMSDPRVSLPGIAAIASDDPILCKLEVVHTQTHVLRL